MEEGEEGKGGGVRGARERLLGRHQREEEIRPGEMRRREGGWGRGGGRGGGREGEVRGGGERGAGELLLGRHQREEEIRPGEMGGGEEGEGRGEEGKRGDRQRFEGRGSRAREMGRWGHGGYRYVVPGRRGEWSSSVITAPPRGPLY